MFENARSQIHLHLTLFCVYATQKGLNEISRQGSTLRSRLLDMTHVVKHNLINARTRIKRKKVLYQNLQNLFLFVVRVDLLPRSAKGGFKGCGENPNSPHVILPSSTECDIREAKRTATDSLDGQSKDLGSFSQSKKNITLH